MLVIVVVLVFATVCVFRIKSRRAAKQAAINSPASPLHSHPSAVRRMTGSSMSPKAISASLDLSFPHLLSVCYRVTRRRSWALIATITVPADINTAPTAGT